MRGQEGGEGGVSPQLILITWPRAVRQMRRVGGRGERRGGLGQITAHGSPHSSFSLSFFPLCVQREFDEKILRLAVQTRISNENSRTCDLRTVTPKKFAI